MKLLAEMSDATFGIGPREEVGGTYELRKSARAILLNSEGDIAIQYLQRDGFHKLPGGGVEGNETLERTLAREIKEEVGCACTVMSEIGLVIEYRKEYELIHLAFCFVAHVEGEIGETALEQKELDEGITVVWMSPQEAYAEIAGENPERYNGKFINARERTFLEEFLERD